MCCSDFDYVATAAVRNNHNVSAKFVALSEGEIGSDNWNNLGVHNRVYTIML